MQPSSPYESGCRSSHRNALMAPCVASRVFLRVGIGISENSPMTHTPAAVPLSTHDTTRIDDTRIRAVRPLITPALLQEWLPAHEVGTELVERSRREISRI